MRKAFYVLFGTLIIMIVVVAMLLIFNVQKVSGASACGSPVGQVADKLNTLDSLGVAYQLGATARVTETESTCTGWVIKINDTVLSYDATGSPCPPTGCPYPVRPPVYRPQPNPSPGCIYAAMYPYFCPSKVMK